MLSGYFALRGERPTDQDIQRVLGEDALQVIVTVFGNTPAFARDSYLLMKQGEQVIKPNHIRFDVRAQAVGRREERLIFFAQKLSAYSPMERLSLNLGLCCWPFQERVER